MYTYNGIRLAGDTPADEECRSLSVAEMIGCLWAIEHSLKDDLCLMDLVPEIIALRTELEERRELAAQVAAEIDAENCRTPH